MDQTAAHSPVFLKRSTKKRKRTSRAAFRKSTISLSHSIRTGTKISKITVKSLRVKEKAVTQVEACQSSIQQM